MRYAIKCMISTSIQSAAKLVDYKGTVLKYRRRKEAELAMMRVAPAPEGIVQQLVVVDLDDTGWISPVLRMY